MKKEYSNIDIQVVKFEPADVILMASIEYEPIPEI